MDFSYNKTQNQRAIEALKREQWLDHNTRAVAIVWSVSSAWSNHDFTSTILIENPGNNVFLNSYSIENIYLSLGEKETI